MSYIQTIAKESILTNLLQMALRTVAGRLGKDFIQVAALGNNSPVGTWCNEVLFGNGSPGCKITHFSPSPNFYIKPFAEFRASDFDCYIILGSSQDERRHIEGLLSSSNISISRGSGVTIDWGYFASAVWEVLGSIDKLPTCLNYQKLFAIASAVYFTPAPLPLVECGVFCGGTTVFLGLLSSKFGDYRPIYALDTYQGLPAPTARDIEGGNYYPQGFFSETSYEGVVSLFNRHGLGEQIVPVQGLVGDTLPGILRSSPVPCGFAFLDLDQYGGIHDALRALTAAGSKLFVIVDDTTIPGVDKAIEDARRGLPIVRTNIGFNFDLLASV